MENAILTILLLAIVGSTLFYLIRAKKRGQKCIGCPYAKECGKSQCNCNQNQNT